MNILYFVTVFALFLSFIKSRGKTKKAIILAFKKFRKISPAFLSMIIAVSIIFYLLPENILLLILDNSDKSLSVMLASLLGSVTLMPGFIAFPLCGLLLEKGVTYTVLSAFTTTLMMVGILTFPIERNYFGVKFAVVRNLVSFLIALIVAAATGIAFGEIVL